MNLQHLHSVRKDFQALQMSREGTVDKLVCSGIRASFIVSVNARQGFIMI